MNSKVPPFTPDSDIKGEVSWFKEFRGWFKPAVLNIKNFSLRHVVSFRSRLMLLNLPSLVVSFRVRFARKSFILYAKTLTSSVVIF